jgi:general secretion pathway protein C
MDTILKKYFWTINLLFLALGAWLLAGTINVVVAHKLRPMPSITKDASKKQHHRRKPGHLSSSQIVVERNYFGSAMAVPIEASDKGPDINDASAANLSDEGVLSDLRAALVGTVVASDAKWSMAMITDLAESETGMYRIKDTLMEEAQVVAILSRKVVISRQGNYEYLELQEKASPKRAGKPSKKKRAGKSDSTLGEGIKKSGKDAWTIDRGEIDKTLSNLNNIAMQARIVPSFKNGEANGFKLFAIRPGSVYSKLGIQNGDIIHKINGYAINSPDKALEIYQKLKSARSVDIELTRRGKSKKLNYKIE